MAIPNEQLLISSILRNGDLPVALKRGLKGKMFHIYPEHYAWIEDFYLKRSRTPTKAAFIQKFEKTFVIKEADDTEHFTEEVRQDHKLKSIAAAADAIMTSVDEHDADNALNTMQRAAMQISTELGLVNDGDVFRDHEDIIKEFLMRKERYELLGASGIPTGFGTFDTRTGGYGPGEFWVIAARPGAMISDSEPILTPRGWVKNGDLKVGDAVVGSDGKPTTVIGVYPHKDKQVYLMTFSDGTVVRAGDEHLWTVNKHLNHDNWEVKTTHQIMEAMAEHGRSYAVPRLTGPVHVDGVFLTGLYGRRYITSVELIDEFEDMTCIAVSNPDSLYAIRSGILTHNTKSFSMQKMAAHAALAGYSVQYNALEQPRANVMARITSLVSPKVGGQIFSSQNLIRGHGYDHIEFMKFMNDLQHNIKGKLHVADGTKGKITASDIAAQIERNKPDIVFVDHITLMGRGSRDWQGVAEVADDLTQISNQYSIPVVSAAQLNRGGVQKEAGLEAIAEADKIGQNASGVIFIKQHSPSVIGYTMEKSRNGVGGFGWWAKFVPDRGVFDEVNYDVAQELIEQDEEEARRSQIEDDNSK